MEVVWKIVKLAIDKWTGKSEGEKPLGQVNSA